MLLGGDLVVLETQKTATQRGTGKPLEEEEGPGGENSEEDEEYNEWDFLEETEEVATHLVFRTHDSVGATRTYQEDVQSLEVAQWREAIKSE